MTNTTTTASTTTSTTTNLSTEMEIAKQYGRLRASHNENDENQKQKSKHVIHLMRPTSRHTQYRQTESDTDKQQER